MAEQIRATAREQVRLQVHEAILETARRQTVAQGWSSVRMGAIAAEVGVSRQALHGEFGTKQALGQALVLREANQFLTGIVAILNENADDPVAAMAVASAAGLDLLGKNELLGSIIGASGRNGDDALLPLLTSRAQPLLDRVTSVLAEWVVEHRPELDLASVLEMVEVLVRVIISYAVMPPRQPAEVGARLARLFEAGVEHTLGQPGASPGLAR